MQAFMTLYGSYKIKKSKKFIIMLIHIKKSKICTMTQAYVDDILVKEQTQNKKN
jgi:hypothetical protein